LRIGARIAMEKTGDPRVWRAPWEGLMGLLVSPSRGVLWFSPFLLLAPWGLRGLAAQPPPQRDATLFAAALGLAFLGVAATWFDWWGGWAYGYRPIVDSMPLWILACTPAVARCARSRAGRVGLALALAWSVGVQGLGAFCSDFAEWNEGSPAHPHEDIDRHRERLWDVADSQILYHLRQPHLKRQMILETANQEAAPLTP
ncbi:MAG TPA: hypothetical protein VFH51_05450, partial [Myxococcota bacterium]|nr:hypothetical protein [Myxococcota bacterium]